MTLLTGWGRTAPTAAPRCGGRARPRRSPAAPAGRARAAWSRAASAGRTATPRRTPAALVARLHRPATACRAIDAETGVVTASARA